MKTKSQEACLQLEHTKVNILGSVYMFKELEVIGDKYFFNISNVDLEIDTGLILRHLILFWCKPVYDTFREVKHATGITSTTWRVCFLSSSCPSGLLVNGSVCDQLLFERANFY